MKQSVAQRQIINYEELSLAQIQLISGLEEATLKELDCETLIIKPLEQIGKHKNEAQKQLKKLKDELNIFIGVYKNSNLLNDISDYHNETDQTEKKEIQNDIIKALQSQKEKLDEIAMKIESIKQYQLLFFSQNKENVFFLQKCIHTFIEHISAFTAEIKSRIQSKNDEISAIDQRQNKIQEQINSLPNLQIQRDDLLEEIDVLYSQLKECNNQKAQNQLNKQDCQIQIKKLSTLLDNSEKQQQLNEQELKRLQFINGSHLKKKSSDNHSKQEKDKSKLETEQSEKDKRGLYNDNNKQPIEQNKEKQIQKDDNHCKNSKETEEIQDLEQSISQKMKECSFYIQQITQSQDKLTVLEIEEGEILQDIENYNDEIEKKQKKQQLLIQEQLEQEKLKLSLIDQKYKFSDKKRVASSEKQSLIQDKNNLTESINLLEDLFKQIHLNYSNISQDANQQKIDLQIESLINNSSQLNRYISQSIFTKENAIEQISLYETSYNNAQIFCNELKLQN